MYPILPAESMIATIQFVCCLFTALAASVGYLMARG